MVKKKFQDLNLNNAFLFAAALEDPETCRMVLEMILERDIPNITVHIEHSILYSSDFRSIRLDVYATDEMRVEYNVEMQNADEKNLAKRARFHQAQMDVASLEPGEDFVGLRPGYVIFICTYDPYGDGLYRYTFENTCRENGRLFGDETLKIVLNTKGTRNCQVSGLLVEFLHYVENSTDSYVKDVAKTSKVYQLHDKIKALKKKREWEERYMKFEELLQEREKIGEAQGREIGEAQGQNKMLELILRMTENNEADQIPRLKSDSQFLNSMYEKYDLQ